MLQALVEWFQVCARDLPWRRTTDPYAIWVSEVMLQQTQVQTVIPFWERWMKRLPNVRALAQADLKHVLKLWEGLGYYRRARHLQQAAQVIVENHHGQFPRQYDDVLRLPGIGRYTAGAICSIAFDLPTPILDGNVIRVLTRVYGITEPVKAPSTKARLWTLAQECIQRAGDLRQTSAHPCSELNQALMELGATVCTPRRPDCQACPLRRFCIAHRKGKAAELPNLEKRAGAEPRQLVAFVISSSDRYLVSQRPSGVVNGQLWEFPNLEVALGEVKPARLAAQVFRLNPPSVQSLCSIRHTITRYRIQLDAYLIALSNSDRLAGWQARIRALEPATIGRRLTADPVEERWCSASELEALAFPSAHRKVLKELRTTVQARKT